MLVTFLILLMMASAQLPFNLQFRDSDEVLWRKIRNIEGSRFVVEHVRLDSTSVRYVAQLKSKSSPTIVFVHGAPGSLSDYARFLSDKELTQKANVISVDRPGYGYSQFGEPMTSLEKQANTLHQALQRKYGFQDIILVGHSYGGPVIAQMAILFPEIYETIVLLAPALDPQNEKDIKIAKMAKWKMTKWMVPMAMKVAAAEKFSHVSELKNLDKKWGDFSSKAIILHGTSDRLVPFENVAYLENKIPDKKNLKTIILKGEDHFLPWTRFDLIKDELLFLL